MEKKKFEDVAFEYEKTFGQQPPILTTLDVNDPLYLEQLEKAIKSGKPITRNDLGAIFMTNDKVFY
jgi:hypothetical protein